MRRLCLFSAGLIAASACADGPATAPEPTSGIAATSDPRIGESRAILDAARKTLRVRPGTRVTVGVLDSGRTFSEATVVVTEEGSRSRYSRFGRSGAGWQRLREISREERPGFAPVPGTTRSASAQLNGLLAQVETQTWGTFYNLYHQGPVEVGSYFTYMYAPEGPRLWEGRWYRPYGILGDSAFVTQFWGWTWNTDPFCPIGYYFESHAEATTFADQSYFCPVTFLGLPYYIFAVVHVPLQVSMTGPAEVVDYGWNVWHTTSSGGASNPIAGSVSHFWDVSYDNGNTWSEIEECASYNGTTSSDCAFDFEPNAHFSFTLRTRVVSLFFHETRESWYVKWIQVNTVPVPPPDPPEDPPPPPPDDPPPDPGCAPYCEIRAPATPTNRGRLPAGIRRVSPAPQPWMKASPARKGG